MELSKAMKRYFLKKQHHGKNAFARYIDLGLGSLVSTVVLFCLFWSLHIGIKLSLVFAICIVFAFILVRSAWSAYKLERFINTELSRITKTTMLEQLTLLAEAEFSETCDAVFTDLYGHAYRKIQGGLFYPQESRFCYAFQNHPENPVGVQQLLLLYRKLKKLGVTQVATLSASAYAEEATAMSLRVGVDFVLLTQDAFFEKEIAYIRRPTQTELYAAIEAEMRSESMKLDAKNVFFSPKKTRAYLLCAGFLLCLYFITKFSVLYPIAAGICLVLAFISYRMQKQTEAKAQYQ